MQRTFLAFIVAGLAFSLIGCGEKNPGTVPVSITITQKGTPLAEVAVTIISSDGKGNTAGGQTNSSGVAVLETPPKWRGAFPGEYAVAVKKWELYEFPDPIPGDPDKMGRSRRNILPGKYGDYATSDFTLTVGSKGAKVTLDIAE